MPRAIYVDPDLQNAYWDGFRQAHKVSSYSPGIYLGDVLMQPSTFIIRWALYSTACLSTQEKFGYETFESLDSGPRIYETTSDVGSLDWPWIVFFSERERHKSCIVQLDPHAVRF